MAKDFGSETLYTLDVVCYLADLRDSEQLTLTQRNVPDLRKVARSDYLIPHSKIISHKKPGLIAMLVDLKCSDLIFSPNAKTHKGHECINNVFQMFSHNALEVSSMCMVRTSQIEVVNSWKFLKLDTRRNVVELESQKHQQHHQQHQPSFQAPPFQMVTGNQHQQQVEQNQR